MNLLIVESPSKAKTIEKYLGNGWRVVASVGHVRDLVPENGSVDTEHDFKPKWQIMPGKEKQIKLIIDELQKADNIYLASDPDREGEAIAWHINDILNARKVLKGKNVYRVAFHEITKNAVMEAIKHPREIDNNLVDAYLVRRILDYLIGFGISPLLWKKNLGKSAGRVQSVAVKLVVDREKEIEAFNPKEYWSIVANCGLNKNQFDANLVKYDGKKIEKTTIENKSMVDKIVSDIDAPTIGKISNIEKKKVQRHAYAPFTTSTLQQDAANKLHFSSKRTMATAQKLYEQGFITYMRTDATNLSNEAVAEIREYIMREYGDKFLPKQPNVYITKSKNAQEAHEAIRPTHFLNAKTELSGDELKLYNLIWKRTIACQMTNAEFDSVSVDIDVKNAVFHCVGTTRTFDGFMKVYIEEDDEKQDNNVKLPPLNINDEIEIKSLKSDQHWTQPPARFTEASLVKKLEELGIGRPSTYATIMSTIVDRKYVEQDKQHRFHPTMSGWILVSYLANYFKDLVDVNFTAKTEDTLDDVSNGVKDKLSSLKSFWMPTHQTIESVRNIKTTDIINKINEFMNYHLFKEHSDICPKCGGKLGIKLSKNGAFVGCTNYPNCNYIMNLADNTYMAENQENNKEIKEKDLGEDIFFKIGKYGPYVTNGTKNVSAKKYTYDTITLDIARELLSGEKKKVEPIILGKNPTTDKPIYYYSDGLYGPYLSSNRVNVSVKEQPSLDEAIDLINNKKPTRKKFVKKAK